MKILFLFVSLIACSFSLFWSGCSNDKETTIYPPPYDTSIAGSTSIDLRLIKECKGVYGEDPLENFQANTSFLITTKASDEEMTLICHTYWGEESVKISIPRIPLSGEPYNVNFDYSTTNTKVIYNTTEWQNVSTLINGWIKRVGFDDTKNAVKLKKILIVQLFLNMRAILILVVS